MSDPRSNEFTHPEGNEDRRDGEWEICKHCDGTGLQSGPGGNEECCHCRGKAEVWLDDEDRFEDDE